MSGRVIFLDVDGVLNYLECWVRGDGPSPVDKDCVARLNRVLDATGARVVLSSAWRGMERAELKLAHAGALGRAYLPSWRTPRTSHETPHRRGDEIAMWLGEHPEITEYAIVDDESDMRPEQMPRFVKTDFHAGGLTDEIADRLIALFSVSPSPTGREG